jgi:hypothetical protein
VIFNDAANLNMTGAGYVWIVTEQALDASNAPDGLLGLKLINATQEKSHITDSLSVYLFGQCKSIDPFWLRSFYVSTLANSMKNCVLKKNRL